MSEHTYGGLTPQMLEALVAEARCPTCTSPRRSAHPAVQSGGEVQPCSHVWHYATDMLARIAQLAAAREDSARLDWAQAHMTYCEIGGWPDDRTVHLRFNDACGKIDHYELRAAIDEARGAK